LYNVLTMIQYARVFTDIFKLSNHREKKTELSNIDSLIEFITRY